MVDKQSRKAGQTNAHHLDIKILTKRSLDKADVDVMQQILVHSLQRRHKACEEDIGLKSTVREGIFDGFLEVFWIFLKNEHGKLKFHPNRTV